MRRLLIIAIILGLPFCAVAGPKEEGQAVFDKFLNDFTSANADGVASHFAPDAIFWGTAARELITTPAGIKQYFVTTFKSPSLAPGSFKASAVGTPSIVALSDDVLAVSGIWQIAGSDNGKPFARELRNSMTIVKHGDAWLITSFHNSPRAPAP